MYIKGMDVDQFTHEVDLAISSIKERIERPSGTTDYDELDDVIRDAELLLSAVVSVEDQLPRGQAEVPSFT